LVYKETKSEISKGAEENLIAGSFTPSCPSLLHPNENTYPYSNKVVL